jgi:hypothetical protein
MNPFDTLTHKMAGDTCLLCGEPPEVIGIFQPENPAAWGAMPGKTRYIRYTLCSKCRAKSDAPENVEAVIRASMDGGMPHA